MIPVYFDYATPSVMESDRDRALVGISANRRRPVRFRGKLTKNGFLFRVALRAFGEAIWSSDSWISSAAILDPVITVHPDGLLFEAFSQDQSVYVQFRADLSNFTPDGEIKWGTTNIDFTAWLWAALAEIRSNRDTWIQVESEGFEVKTVKAGGRFEKKVDLPDSWVRGFLQLQAAMSIPGTRLTTRPVDLLAPIRFLRYAKARISPRALRYEFMPGKPPEIVLEPWEKSFLLRKSDHTYTEPKTIRTWGRRRLKLIEPLLPFADEVDIYLKGRAMPSFYVVKLPGMSFTLGLSGWSENQWTDTDGFGIFSETSAAGLGPLPDCLRLFQEKLLISLSEVTTQLAISREQASILLSRMCRQGKLMFDLGERKFRYRELFEASIDEAAVFPPSERLERARKMIHEGSIRVVSCEPQERCKIHSLKTAEGRVSREIIHRDWHVAGISGSDGTVEIVVKDNVHIIFGKCHCELFRDHLLSKGPCEEMIALFRLSEPLRGDLPTSRDASVPKEPSRGQRTQNPDGEGQGEEDKKAVDEEKEEE